MYIIHIGVGSDVVCSTLIGNARASVRGMDDGVQFSTLFLFMYTTNSRNLLVVRPSLKKTVIVLSIAAKIKIGNQEAS